MRSYWPLIIIFCAAIGFAQPGSLNEHFYFHVTIEDPESLSIVKNDLGTYTVVNPADPKESSIYASYGIFEFEPAFAASSLSQLKKVYRVVTDDVKLLGGLLYKYPEKYSRIDQFYPGEAPFYPNDYGTTSPVPNLGAEHPLHDLDLINAAGAWGITTGSPKVVVGISDSKVDSTHIDLQGRVSNFLAYFTQTKGMLCAHGTNVAGIAIGRMNNAHGRPGLCSGCDVVTNKYGDFKYVEELVAAGARVINASWARCSMGTYHKNIEDRINELYEDGIIIVAGAGNGKNCNRDDDYAPDDYAYPASYEKVISVTGVYAQFDKAEDNTYIGKEGRPTAGFLKDRHSSEYGIKNDGTLHPKYRKWDMQFNRSVDICAPSESYLMGNDFCGEKDLYGGATSSAAPYITGVIGLIWSVNYCLDAYETETVLKLTSANIDDLPGNEYYKGQLGAGRVDAYRAVKMARDMKELMGKVAISGRDFSRFTFKLQHSPYDIEIRDQTFRDSSVVDFKARNQIKLKPGTRLAPDTSGSIRLSTDPSISTDECFPKPVKQYTSVFEAEARDTKQPTVIRKSFVVELDSETKKIVLKPNNSSVTDQKTGSYSVQVLSPARKVIHQQVFTFPKEGVLSVEFGEYNYLMIEITINGRTEVYRVKRS